MGSSFEASHQTSARHTTEESARRLAWLTLDLHADGLIKNQFWLVLVPKHFYASSPSFVTRNIDNKGQKLSS